MKKYGLQIVFWVFLLVGIQSEDVFAGKCTQAQHEYEVTVVEYATGETDGLREYTCIYCGDQYTEVIPRTGHQFGEYQTQQEADCATQGVRYRICEHCGLIEYETIPYTDEHSFGEWQTVENEQKETLFNQLDIWLAILNIVTIGLFLFFIYRDYYVINWDRKHKALLKEWRKIK